MQITIVNDNTKDTGTRYASATTANGNIGGSNHSQAAADAQAAAMDAAGNVECFNCDGCSDCYRCRRCVDCVDCHHSLDCKRCSGSCGHMGFIDHEFTRLNTVRKYLARRTAKGNMGVSYISQADADAQAVAMDERGCVGRVDGELSRPYVDFTRKPRTACLARPVILLADDEDYVPPSDYVELFVKSEPAALFSSRFGNQVKRRASGRCAQTIEMFDPEFTFLAAKAASANHSRLH